MRDSFRPMFDALRKASGHLTAATNSMIAANNSFGEVIDAAIAANEEHEDLRETVNRLEQLVIEQGNDIRALRAELRDPGIRGDL